MLNEALVTDTVFPARSLAVPVTVWFAPSVETVWSGGQMAMPDAVSVQSKCAVTGSLFHPFAFAGGVRLTVIVGAVRSMLKGRLVTDAVLPARSVAVPVAVRLIPSRSKTWSAGQVTMPEPASSQTKWARIGVLSQPVVSLGTGDRSTVIVGLVWSMLMPPSVMEPTLQARSTACPVVD